ncbi:MAG: response regulator [Bacteroidetes bacterium]|nr:response regulator [Bacteroidota bacterium]
MMKMLISDTDESCHLLYKKHFGDKFDVIFTADIENFIEELNTTKYDVIILDPIYRRQQVGESLLKKIRNDSLSNEAYVICITAYIEKELETISYNFGANHFLLKPTNFKNLRAKILDALTDVGQII